MRFSVISSGSKANCTFIESGSTRILIDCGLSARETDRRLRLIGISPDSIDAVLITHEHSDHTRGLKVFTNAWRIPVFANAGTARHLPSVYGMESFSTGEAFCLGSFKISPFSIAHDAADPVGFRIDAEGLRFAQATDLGRVTPLVREALRGCHAVVLESNHDQEMLRECGYPWELKQRIASSHGHLSNDTAATLLAELMHPELLHIVLGHLSENSNTPALALQAVARYIAEHERAALRSPVRCADIYTPTPLETIGEAATIQNIA